MAQTVTTAFPTFLDVNSTSAAQQLLGCYFVREVAGRTIRLRVVETESYDQLDAASHSFSGQTPRTDVMFGPSGHLYVYFTYGMHYCMNVVTGPEGEGSAVLIRALEACDNLDYLENVRGRSGVQTTNGPAKLCQALGIDRIMNGHDLRQTPLRLEQGEPLNSDDIVTTTRIGISRERDALRRFYVRGNTYVSHV